MYDNRRGNEKRLQMNYFFSISKLMVFNFRNNTIFWDIPKWNKGQTN